MMTKTVTHEPTNYMHTQYTVYLEIWLIKIVTIFKIEDMFFGILRLSMGDDNWM